MVADQDGLATPRSIAIGESKMAWEPAWSPDGKQIAFEDNKVRVRIVDVESGRIRTVDAGGANIERGGMELAWSPDSRYLVYAKTFPNMFRRIVVWSRDSGSVTPLTDALADAAAPVWDRNGRHLYFLASTNLALGSGWANTSSIAADPSYGVYLMVLRADDPTPFAPRSDEEGERLGRRAGPHRPRWRRASHRRPAHARAPLHRPVRRAQGHRLRCRAGREPERRGAAEVLAGGPESDRIRPWRHPGLGLTGRGKDPVPVRDAVARRGDGAHAGRRRREHRRVAA